MGGGVCIVVCSTRSKLRRVRALPNQTFMFSQCITRVASGSFKTRSTNLHMHEDFVYV